MEANGCLEAAGITGHAAFVASLALEELGTNILKYGYDDAAVHEILLRLECQPGTLRLVLEDDGHPFNPLDAPEPDVEIPVEDRAVGGLGLHLVRKMADRMDYQRCGERNRVIVEMKLGASPEQAQP